MFSFEAHPHSSGPMGRKSIKSSVPKIMPQKNFKWNYIEIPTDTDIFDKKKQKEYFYVDRP